MRLNNLLGSRKAVGLGFVAIIVLLALVLFIFKYSTMVYEFPMKAGEEQAHLVTAYTELEKAKVYTAYALRPVAYELLWDEKVLVNTDADTGAKSCVFTSVCDTNKQKRENIVSKEFYDLYASRYETYSELLEAELPGEYRVELNCDEPGKLGVEAFGYSEECYLSNRFAFPEFPCRDQDDPAKCNAVKFINGNSGACKWDYGVCEETNPAPDCASASDESSCKSKQDSKSNNVCDWLASYSEKIKVRSPFSMEYKFEVGSDAHLLETISCDEYLKFAEVRKLIPYAVGIIRVEKTEDGRYKIRFKVDNIKVDESGTEILPEVKVIDLKEKTAQLIDLTISEASSIYSKYRTYEFQTSTTGKYYLQISCEGKLHTSFPFTIE